MNSMAKILTRPHVCQHCGTEVRMNLVYTVILSLLYFFVAVKVLLAGAMSVQSMIYLGLVTLVFVVLCLLIPFEKKP